MTESHQALELAAQESGGFWSTGVLRKHMAFALQDMAYC